MRRNQRKQWKEAESNKQWQCNSKETCNEVVGMFLLLWMGLEVKILYSWLLKLQIYCSQGGSQENKGGQPLRTLSKAMSRCQGHGLHPPCHWGRCLPQRHDPNSCCTSSSLVWHWKHRRRLFCLDRLVSSDRSVFSSSRGRFTGEASFSDCESDQTTHWG